jgi:hypothetical protein
MAERSRHEEKIVFGADAQLHPTTGLPLETGIGALTPDEQVVQHRKVIEEKHTRTQLDELAAATRTERERKKYDEHGKLLPPGRQASTVRPGVDQVFGIDAPVICGLPIEIGSGAKSPVWQLARHLARIRSENGDDAARALFQQLRNEPGVDQRSLDAELVLTGFMAAKTAEGAKELDEYQPGETPN